MFSPSLPAFLVLFTASTALLARADPQPNEPGPGDKFNEGAQCHIAWEGDASGGDTWKETNIELMTGSNFQMVHITTVTTVDGTKSGTYDWPCPDVTPNSAVYFYQFSSPLSPNKTWTTRFTIADASGNSVPPENPTQPGTNAAIPWGTGKLVDPSQATPPPSGAGGSGSSSLPSVSGSSSALVVSTSAPASSVSLSAPSQVPSGFSSSSRSPSPTSALAASQSASGANSNGAAGGLVLDGRAWHAAVVLCASTLAFTILL